MKDIILPVRVPMKDVFTPAFVEAMASLVWTCLKGYERKLGDLCRIAEEDHSNRYDEEYVPNDESTAHNPYPANRAKAQEVCEQFPEVVKMMLMNPFDASEHISRLQDEGERMAVRIYEFVSDDMDDKYLRTAYPEELKLLVHAALTHKLRWIYDN